MKSRPMRKVLMRRYRPAAGLAVLVVVLVSAWAGEGGVARAERKASGGQGGVASHRVAVGQQTSHPSAPVQKDAGTSRKQRIGKGLAPEKSKGLKKNSLSAARIAARVQPSNSGLRPHSLRSLTCPIMACFSSRSGIPRVMSMAREGFQTRIPARCSTSISKNSTRIETARSIRLSGPWAGSILSATSLITSGSRSVSL